MGAVMCPSTTTLIVPISFLALLLLLSLPTTSGSSDGLCSEAFWMEGRRQNVTHCKQLRVLGAELGWHVSRFNSQWTKIDVMFGARLRFDVGWLAWGVNPLAQPQMIGTRAIIGIRQPNGSLLVNTYNITSDNKKGCRLLPAALDIEVWNTTSSYIEEEDLFTMSAAVIVPDSQYNVLKLNHVWQVGYEADGAEPRMHLKTLHNFDSTETLNLSTEESGDVRQKNHQSYLRKVHGILNIIAWGTILPVGVIFARYFRKHPFQFKDRWYYLHISCQITGYAIGTAGWSTGLTLGNESHHYTFRIHRLLAIFIFTFTTLQMFALRLRPDINDEYRKYWNMYHHFLGYGLFAVIIPNIFHGIAILKPDNAIWNWVYIGILVLLSAVVLSLEAYSWVKFFKSKHKKQYSRPVRSGGNTAAAQSSQTSAN